MKASEARANVKEFKEEMQPVFNQLREASKLGITCVVFSFSDRVAAQKKLEGYGYIVVHRRWGHNGRHNDIGAGVDHFYEYLTYVSFKEGCSNILFPNPMSADYEEV